MYTVFPTELNYDLRERLSRIKYILTDADGTMITGSKATVNSAGKPSFELIKMLCELKDAGIQIVPVTGRNRAMIYEDARILNLDGWIAEMGGILCTKQASDPEWSYYTGDMDYDPACGKTPHDVICDTGILDEIMERYAGRVETYHDNNIGFEYREVTLALRGTLPEDEIQKMLDATGLPLYMSNNGFVRRITGPTTLMCDREHPKDVHTYHIMPKGLTKGSSIKRYLELRGWSTDECLGAGDSPADMEIADVVGTFLFMKNGLDHPAALEQLESRTNVLVSQKPSTDGWVETMKLLLAAHA